MQEDNDDREPKEPCPKCGQRAVVDSHFDRTVTIGAGGEEQWGATYYAVGCVNEKCENFYLHQCYENRDPDELIDTWDAKAKPHILHALKCVCGGEFSVQATRYDGPTAPPTIWEWSLNAVCKNCRWGIWRASKEPWDEDVGRKMLLEIQQELKTHLANGTCKHDPRGNKLGDRGMWNIDEYEKTHCWKVFDKHGNTAFSSSLEEALCQAIQQSHLS